MPKTFKSVKTVEVPKELKVSLDGKIITIKGKLGSIANNFDHMKEVDIVLNKKLLTFTAYFPRNKTIAKLGTLASIVENAIVGVTKGYSVKMKIAYSHFPITLVPPKSKKGNDEILIKNFLGERSPRYTYTYGPNITITANKEDVVVKGIDKNAVTQTAARIQQRCRIRNKDKRTFQDGIYVYEKYAGDEIIWHLI